MEKIIDGKYELYDIKPEIHKFQIFFPVEIKHEYIEEDGRSLGYPGDSGWFSIVKYDYAIGALVDDTIALIQSLNKPRAPHSGICPIKGYHWSDNELDSWKKDLDPAWAEAQFKEWKQEGLIDENETEESWIKDRINNYHCWPQEWKKVYDKQREQLNKPNGKTEIILKNKSLTLYQDEIGDYFFTTSYHDYGRIQKADKKAAEKYRDEFKTYQTEFEKYKVKMKLINANLKILKENL